VLFDGDMMFLGGNADLLAFTREKDGERLVFVFNLTRQPQEYTLPEHVAGCTPLAGPGMEAILTDGVVSLPPMSGFAGTLGE
jgi:alpha-glucosidase